MLSKMLIKLGIVFIIVGLVQGTYLPGVRKQGGRYMHITRGLRPLSITPNNRTTCPETPENRPINRVNTTEQLAALRQEMNTPANLPGTLRKLDAYLIDKTAEHSHTTAYDKRLQYISGFSGSNGVAWVTPTEAAFETDGRYFDQAEAELDCNWILLGPAGTPDKITWLLSVVPEHGNVGADPKIISISTWKNYESLLAVKNITMVQVEDLIDLIWTEDRPEKPNNPIRAFPMDFAGVSWQDKVTQIRLELAVHLADVLVSNALDETAWLYNLRGKDFASSPFFLSYAMLMQDEIRLYLNNFMTLISNATIRDHLNTKLDGTCDGKTEPCVNVREYSQFIEDLVVVSAKPGIDKIWYDPSGTYAMHDAIGTEKGYEESSPIQLIKSIKNQVERTRFPDSLMRDSAALCEFMALIEKEVQEGKNWTELSASLKSIEIRSQYEYNDGVSFFPICAFAANSAIVHYRPTVTTSIPITTNDIFMIDSGGQYYDGTTDVTRTYHFGTPTDQHKEVYTRVLMGNIDLAVTKWPAGLLGSDIDARARAPLWYKGWDFNHGTGHGVGYYLDIHEGPASIRTGYHPSYEPLYDGMFFSDEPGYYISGEFGVRLENMVEIRTSDVAENYLEFQAHTLVPFEPHLIKYELLTFEHRKWLNAYHKRCEEQTAVYLRNVRDDQLGYDWVIARTKPIPEDPNWDGGDTSMASSVASYMTLPLVLVIAFLFSLKE